MPTTLLLADDSVTIQRVIELTFADEDIDVVTVSDGDQAIAELSRNPPPDIVLADVGMPGRTGYEVAQHVRDNPGLAHIPVLLLTGAFEPVDQERASAVGCSGVLAKPFEPQFVITRVKELLAGQQKSVEPPGEGPDPSGPGTPVTAGATPVAEYFDRLDEAFATFSGEVGGQIPAATVGDRPAEAQPLTEPALSYGSSEGDFAPVAAAPADASLAAPAVFEATSSSAPALVPPLADAFAGLLAAEQAVPASGAPVWPATQIQATPSDDVVEQVSRRVLEQLTDRVVRDTVADIVSEVAERLVRAEIDRIKSAID